MSIFRNFNNEKHGNNTKDFKFALIIIAFVLISIITIPLEVNVFDLNMDNTHLVHYLKKITFVEKQVMFYAILTVILLGLSFNFLIKNKLNKIYTNEKILYTYHPMIIINIGFTVLFATYINEIIVPFLVFYNYILISPIMLISFFTICILALFAFCFFIDLQSFSYILTNKKLYLTSFIFIKERNIKLEDIERIQKERLNYKIIAHNGETLNIGICPRVNRLYKKLIELVCRLGETQRIK